MKLRLLFVLLASLTAAACHEASKVLASNSRLPVWFKNHGQHHGSQITVTLDTYSGPFGWTGTFTLWNASGQSLAEQKTNRKTLEPIRLESRPGFSYEVFTGDGHSEGIQLQLRPDGLVERDFRLVDDPAVIAQLGISR